MRTATRSIFAVSVLTLLAGDALAGGLPNIDAFGQKAPSPSRDAALRQKAAGLTKPGSPLQGESRLGVPTFLWAKPGSNASLGSRGGPHGDSEVSAARSILASYASLYGLDTSDVAGAVVDMIHNTGKGPIIVKFRQQVDGIDVFREEVNVLMKRDLEAIAISGFIASRSTPAARPGAKAFVFGAAAASALAVRDASGVNVSASQLGSSGTRDGYEYFVLPASSGVALDEPVRSKPVFFHLPDGLEAGYYVEVIGRLGEAESVSIDGPIAETVGYGYVISAVTGEILFRKNLSNDAAGAPPKNAEKGANATPGVNVLPPGGFTYRVWADPVSGIPYDTPAGNAVHPKVVAAPDAQQYPFVGQADVTLPNFPFSQNDPWLAPGATETVGNNTDAFVNLFNPDGYGPVAAPADPATGDFRAQITAPGQFLHSATAGAEPKLAEPRQSDIQQLFYNVNFLHDWFYDAGFDEASRNAQDDNFGRGGAQLDRIKAQAQDVSGRNNANMLTPADGTQPRMRMYVFDTASPKFFETVSPGNIAGAQSVGTGQFGAQVFDTTAVVVQPNPASGCTAASYADPAIPGGAAGKIVLVNREPTATCSIGTKLNFAMAAGAAGFVLVNLSTTPDTLVNVTGSLPSFTIPFQSVTWNGAQAIKAELAVPNVVTGRMVRTAGLDRDGTIDNQIVFHEWGHYLSNRLIGNAGGLNTNMSGGMGEGWGDTIGMALTVRSDDTATPSNANWNGAYALATYATSGGTGTETPASVRNQGYYYGIRRYPYSTDIANINPLTYKHIQNGVALPVGPPVAFGASGGNNAEVHNTGEVWAVMLWECYASLLRDTLGGSPRLTFQQAQDRWRQYLVASMKMTPINPTFLEARDAVLAAANATDVTDYVLFRQAFAKRGLGIYAVSPDRYSSNNSGTLTESFDAGPEIFFSATSLDDSVANCDGDGVLDSGEIGHLLVTLRNIGTSTLTATTGTVTSGTPGVSITGSLSFPSVAPLATTTGLVTVKLAPGLAGPQALDFQVDWNDPQLTGGPRTANASHRGNTNSIPASTATDTVEASSTLWTTTSVPPTVLSGGITFVVGGVEPWARKTTSALQHYWHGTDAGISLDERLTSPIFTVDGSGSFNLQFDHSWGFEFDGGGNYDGGVVEIAVNGGAFTDFGATAYTGLILNNAAGLNPLRGRQGFVQNSPGTVHTSLTQAIAPGSTVQVRFRSGADSSVGAAGWDIDNIAFSGVVETPFTTLVADTGCSLPTTTSLGTSANPSPAGVSLTLTATVASAGSPPNSGTVTFLDGGSAIGTGPVTAGTAQFITSSLSQGAHNLQARFEGIAGYLPSTSSTLVENISAALTTVGVLSNANPSALSQSVTFTATVSATAGTPNGSVTFLDGATPLATVALSSGQAQYTTSTLAGGSHTINVNYAGNANFGASTGNVVQVVTVPTITPGGPTTFCEPGTVTLTSSIVTAPGTTLLWSPGGATTDSIIVSASGSYTVTATVGGVSGTSAATVVTVNPNPTPSITAPATAAQGATGLIASVPNNAGSTYAWTITNGTITAGAGTNQITFTAGTTLGPLQLGVVETRSTGCVSAQGTATVTVVNPPRKFYVAAPCRAVDTRVVGGPLGIGETRSLAVTGTCGIPATAKSVSVNITATNGTAVGSTILFPADMTGTPTGPAVYFKVGQTRANNGIVRFAYDGTGLKVVNASAGTVDFIVDVNGWFE